MESLLCPCTSIKQVLHLYKSSSVCVLRTKQAFMLGPQSFFVVWLCVCVFIKLHITVCVFSSHPFWTSSSLDVLAGVTQEEGHTGFLIHLPSAVRALIFVARRIQPFLSLVDRGVEFCVLTNSSFSTRWAFLFWFFSF